MSSRKKYDRHARRRQQVYRKTFVLGIIILIIVCIVLSCVKRENKQEEVKEAAKTEQQKVKKKEKKEKEETEEERLERVKIEAEQNGYPEGVINLLSKNVETVDFVEHYAKKKDNPSADVIGKSIEAGTIPHLLQWDERWGYAPYGTSIVAVSGCGPTCMSMVASGLNEDVTITPAKVAEYGTENGYVDGDNNTLWAFMKEAGANWNLSCKEGILDENWIAKELQSGHPIICSVGPGNFTTDGHFIVLTRYENGNISVNDPFSNQNSERTWTFGEIKDQIMALWSYAKM